jgi:hypothetical protein
MMTTCIDPFFILVNTKQLDDHQLGSPLSHTRATIPHDRHIYEVMQEYDILARLGTLPPRPR